MGKWIIAVVAAALLAGGCGGGYKPLVWQKATVADIKEDILEAYDYDFEDGEGFIRFSGRSLFLAGDSGFVMYDGGRKERIPAARVVLYFAAAKEIEADLAARFEALKN